MARPHAASPVGLLQCESIEQVAARELADGGSRHVREVRYDADVINGSVMSRGASEAQSPRTATAVRHRCHPMRTNCEPNWCHWHRKLMDKARNRHSSNSKCQ